MLQVRASLAEYTLRLQSEGRVSFTAGEAKAALGISNASFLKSAERLQKKGLLANPRQGFYVVVPPQYLAWGAPPPAWYIDALMKHEGRAYYVGLLKAAELHGATHQAVMEFQVVTDKQFPRLRVGRSVIAFYFRKDIAPVLHGIADYKTDTGVMKVSAPELTILDLVRYLHATGGVDSVATVLSDLRAKIDPEKLSALADHFERTTIQRLGFLLERLGSPDKTENLHHLLFTKKPVPWIALEPQKRGTPAPPWLEQNERWHVNVHRYPEIDE